MKHDIALQRVAGDIGRRLKKSFQKAEDQRADGRNAYRIDYEMEELIEQLAKESFPGYAVYTEDRGLYNTHGERGLLIFDPVDGSANFVRHIPVFNVSIAICDFSVADTGKFSFDQVIAACVFSPLLERMHYAEHGLGGRLNGNRINRNPLQSRGQEYVGGIMEFTAERDLRFLSKFKSFRAFGCATEHLCSIARGDFKAYFALDKKLRVPDIAAAGKILLECGGAITDLEGGLLSIGLEDHVNFVAGVDSSHATLLRESIMGI
jgi:myo-inositol-1(or 4)-monophosphatase